MYKLKAILLAVFGRIKIYKFPFFLLYDPTTYTLKGHHYLEVREIIHPGDILIRGYKHYLDGYFIPGNYTHAAMYLGEDEIIHAMTPDVQYIDLIAFMRCDRIAVIRPVVSNKERDTAIARAVSREKIPYDYDFDFKDNGKLSCSELIHYAYRESDLGWKMKTIGFWFLKKTIFAPDDVMTGNVRVVYKS